MSSFKFKLGLILNYQKVYSAALNGTTAQMLAQPHIIWGIVALVCVDMIFLFSTRYWRERAYNFFLTTHITGFILVLPAVCILLFFHHELHLINRSHLVAGIPP